MILCVTGCDFSGKTTLIKKLDKNSTALVLHNGTYPDLNSDELFQVYRNQLDLAARAARDRDVYIDRAPIDEAVYGPIYRGGSRLDLPQLISLDILAERLGVKKLFLDTPDEILIERFRGDRGDDLVRGEAELLEIADSYRGLLGKNRSGATNWIRWTPGHDFITSLL